MSAPESGAGLRGPGCSAARGLAFLGWRGVAASPAPLEQLPPCALRGREREAGKSYFSKLLSSSGLPGDSCGGRERRGRRGPVTFRNAGPWEPRVCLRPAAPSSRACPTPRPRPGWVWGQASACRRSVWRPGRPGEGREPPGKLLCHGPAPRSRPGGAARTRATRAWSAAGSGGSRPARRASPCGVCGPEDGSAAAMSSAGMEVRGPTARGGWPGPVGAESGRGSPPC